MRPRRHVLLGGTTLASTSRRRCSSPASPRTVISTRRSRTGGKLITTSGAETELGNLAVTADGHILVAATSSGAGPTAACSCASRPPAPVTRRFGTHGEVGFRLGGAATTFSDVALDGAGRIYLAGSRATTPRHQMVVARADHRRRARPGLRHGAGYAVADLNGASADRLRGRRPPPARRRRRHRARRLHRQERDRPRLAPGRPRPAHARGRAGRGVRHRRHAHAGRLALARHRHDRLVTLPDGGSSSAARWPSAPPPSSALAGYHDDGTPDTTLNPANATAANAANLQVGTGGVDRILALALTPQGSNTLN